MDDHVKVLCRYSFISKALMTITERHQKINCDKHVRRRTYFFVIPIPDWISWYKTYVTVLSSITKK